MRLAIVVVMMVLLSSLVGGQEEGASAGSTPGATLIYDITTTNNIEVGVGTVIYLRTPSRVDEEDGTALFSRTEFKGEDYYIYAYHFKTTGTLLVKDKQGNAVTIRVTSPEEEKRAQEYASRLQVCLAKVSALEPLVAELQNKTETLEANLTYYKRIVEENQTIVKTNYVMGKEEWIAAMQEWRRSMTFWEFAKMFWPQLLIIFLFGVFAATAVILVIRKIRFVPSY